MFLEDLAEACEHMDLIADSTEHTRRHLLPRSSQ
jgi:hypothetical protein